MTTPDGHGSTAASAKAATSTVPERSIGQLVADATKDVSELVRYEVALAKAEITTDVKNGALGGALFAVAGVFGFVAFVFLGVTVAYALVEGAGWPVWLAFLVVAAAMLLVAGALAAVGFGRVKKVGPPERAIRSTKDTIAAVKASASGKPVAKTIPGSTAGRASIGH
ncbi:phage holin family protein [Paenibacillus sp. TRM 82003]|uniref:phage holin family protein n=1 Tax=Kineococcus sp. TRM81007 TaxID=2925831 RepID=UPI001F58656C|nr:phage holin family protein [Kineococcus sp. TRM81007]MCI2239553.1 phage holin family protein [Kineococcus sp. TRM81007]MCI3926165.1 phage holin family protein [Paenibacillus sp. TRM 82003]